MIDEKAITVIDPQTSEMQAREVFMNEFDISTMLSTAGRLNVTKEQTDKLFAPIDSDVVEIRPDGLIYAGWEVYQTRLRDVFPCKYAFIAQGMPQVRREENGDATIVWGFWLIIDGVLMGFAIGESKYRANNATMSYTDACESAKSNAKMRLCKDIGIFPELWTPKWTREWQSQYAESYQVFNEKKGENETRWKKKGSSVSTEEGTRKLSPSEFILPFKKAKELTGKEKPTLKDIADTGKAGLDYLKYIAGWEEAKQATRDAINAFLKDAPENGTTKQESAKDLVAKAQTLKAQKTDATQRPYAPNKVKQWLTEQTHNPVFGKPLKEGKTLDGLQGAVKGKLEQFGNDEKQGLFLELVFNKKTTKELSISECRTLIWWFATKEEKGEWVDTDMTLLAKAEFARCAEQMAIDKGQTQLPF